MKLLKILYVSFLCIAATTAMERLDNDPIYQEYLADISNPDLQLYENMADEYLNIFDTDNSLTTQQETSGPDATIVEKDDSKETVTGKGEQHRMISHQQCPGCDKLFPTKRGLKHHITQSHTEKEKLCPHCDTLFPTERGLKQHIMQLHKKKEKQCPHCNKLFATELGLSQHQTKAHAKKVDETISYICDICSQVLENQAGLDFHKNKAHSMRIIKNNFICTLRLPDGTECGDIFSRKHLLICHQNHETKHNPSWNSSNTIDNNRNEANKDQFVCTKDLPDGTKCGTTFARQYNLVYHQKHAQKHRQTINVNKSALLNNILTQTSITASPAPLNEEQTMRLTADLEKEFQQSDTINNPIYQKYLTYTPHSDFQLHEDIQSEYFNFFDTSDDLAKELQQSDTINNEDPNPKRQKTN